MLLNKYILSLFANNLIFNLNFKNFLSNAIVIFALNY